MNAKNSKPCWPARIVPPKGAPNVLLIMTDDQGYGISSTFGGVIPTPTLDRIAKAGLRYTQFHSTSLCSPVASGAAHRTQPSLRGIRRDRRAGHGLSGIRRRHRAEQRGIGEILKENGYATSWFGKNHNTPGYQYSMSGPFDQWPSGMGFDYFYGFMGGESDQWKPWLFQDHTQIFPWIGHPGYNLITDMADEAIKHIRGLNAAAPDQPFLVYYAPGGSHAPHQPTPEWIKKISDMHLFDKGWNDLRDQIFANQKRLGVIPANTQLTPWPDGQTEYGGAKLAKWDTLSPEEKKLFIRQADVFAAYAAYTDYEIGRVIQEIQDEGKLDNTLIIYICGDNGTSAEGSLVGTPFDMAALEAVDHAGRRSAEVLRRLGFGQDTAAHGGGVGLGLRHAVQVDQADSVALRRYQAGPGDLMARSHHGCRWHPPAVPPLDRHRADDSPGSGYPGARGRQWRCPAADRRREHGLHVRQSQRQRAVDPHDAVLRDDGKSGDLSRRLDRDDDAAERTVARWAPSLCRMSSTSYHWELYNITEGLFRVQRPREPRCPTSFSDLQQLFLVEASKYGVLPLDNDVLQRALTPRPSAVAGKTVFTYTAEVSGTPEASAPPILNKSFSISAEVEIPHGGAEGMINTLGGKFGGYGLYLLKSKPVFTYVQLTAERFRWEGPALSPGKHTIMFDFKYEGEGFGKGGTGVLSVDGKEVDTKRMPYTIPFLVSMDESFDVGVDTRYGMDDSDYQPPFRFTGKLDKLTIKVMPPQTTAKKKSDSAIPRCHGFAAGAASKPPPRARCRSIRLASRALRSLMTDACVSNSSAWRIRTDRRSIVPTLYLIAAMRTAAMRSSRAR